jgi:hypothetical protein
MWNNEGLFGGLHPNVINLLVDTAVKWLSNGRHRMIVSAA